MEQGEWEKPELIVLVRSNPEEAVLTTCKIESTPVGQQLAPDWNEFKGCVDLSQPGACSQNCQSRGGGGS